MAIMMLVTIVELSMGSLLFHVTLTDPHDEDVISCLLYTARKWTLPLGPGSALGKCGYTCFLLGHCTDSVGTFSSAGV